MSNLANNLRILRERRGLTKTQMAKLLNLTLPGYSFYEKGERDPALTTLQKIATVLNVTIDDLLAVALKENKENNEELSDSEMCDALWLWGDAGFSVERRGDGYVLIEPSPELAEQCTPLEIRENAFLRLTNKMSTIAYVPYAELDKDKFATMTYVVMNKKAALRRENPFTLVGEMIPLEYLPLPMKTKRASE